MRWSRIRLKIPSFNNLPLSPDVLNRMQAGFPSIQTPTHAQAELISRISNGYDVLLKADTGDGK